MIKNHKILQQAVKSAMEAEQQKIAFYLICYFSCDGRTEQSRALEAIQKSLDQGEKLKYLSNNGKQFLTKISKNVEKKFLIEEIKSEQAESKELPKSYFPFGCKFILLAMYNLVRKKQSIIDQAKKEVAGAVRNCDFYQLPNTHLEGLSKHEPDHQKGLVRDIEEILYGAGQICSIWGGGNELTEFFDSLDGIIASFVYLIYGALYRLYALLTCQNVEGYLGSEDFFKDMVCKFFRSFLDLLISILSLLGIALCGFMFSPVQFVRTGCGTPFIGLFARCRLASDVPDCAQQQESDDEYSDDEESFVQY